MKKKFPKTIKEYFTIDPSRSALAAFVGISKPGYRLTTIDRKFDKCTLTFVRI